ncbi:hypothetical protein [Bacteriovorax sp. Seq25_V]|uniref:hypothetical protein n=1 Tax=Bacteriovorax sp. Seq25_V TaxID=1201288 RepID=UPI00038A2720|nr:hypothetical protein [Bacteriovorax sp. Seq25_V]EQC47459.1 hypothetical protein M900_0927 [Bacteriovorax sp. Seq25_V]
MKRLLLGFLILSGVLASISDANANGSFEEYDIACIKKMKCSEYNDGKSNLLRAIVADHQVSATIPDRVFIKIAFRNSAGQDIVLTGKNDFYGININSRFLRATPAQHNKSRMNQYEVAVKECNNMIENLEFMYDKCE